MLLITFMALLALACAIALVDWRRGWLLAVFIGILQDPVRKLVPGTPVYLSLSMVAVYAVVLFAAQRSLAAGVADFSRRYPHVREAVKFLILALILAFCRGLVTFGLGAWQAPALSLFTYLLPLPAILFGYVYLDRVERLERFLKVYAAIASVAMIGGVLEFFRVPWKTVGTVALNQDWIRHLPGIQVRILAGFFRGPDIMAWHAGMLTIVGVIFVVRRRLPVSLFWAAIAGWGFINCMISGRRKMVYMVAIFTLLFVAKQFRRFKASQVTAVVVTLLLFSTVVYQISTSGDESSAYAKASRTTREELAQRFEGGFVETFRQYGILGGGLGLATQGAYHLLPQKSGQTFGWQEGGAGKIAVELGLIGVVAILLVGYSAGSTMYRIGIRGAASTKYEIERVALFSVVTANVASFLASAQPYTDPSLALITAFFVGALFAIPRLDETKDTALDSSAPVPVVRTPAQLPATTL